MFGWDGSLWRLMGVQGVSCRICSSIKFCNWDEKFCVGVDV